MSLVKLHVSRHFMTFSLKIPNRLKSVIPSDFSRIYQVENPWLRMFETEATTSAKIVRQKNDVKPNFDATNISFSSDAFGYNAEL